MDDVHSRRLGIADPQSSQPVKDGLFKPIRLTDLTLKRNSRLCL